MTQIDKSRFEWIGSDSARREGISRPSTTFWKDAIGRLMKNKVAVVCFFIIVLLILSCIIVPFFSPFESREQHLGEVNKGFMTVCTDSRYEGQHHVHYFGTDNLGRDLFLRAFEGGRVSLMIAFAAVFVNLIVGLIYGGISGYLGGTVDMIMMRIVDIISTIPLTLYVILIMQVLGAGIQSIIVALGSVYWVDMARVVRGQILSLKQQEFVLAAKTIGSSATTILFDHLIPNALGSILVTITMLIPSAIFMEAFLGYLGIGLQPPLASLGTMCNDASANLRTSPHELLIPALMICVIMFAFNFVGDGLRDALDPKLKK